MHEIVQVNVSFQNLEFIDIPEDIESFRIIEYLYSGVFLFGLRPGKNSVKVPLSREFKYFILGREQMVMNNRDLNRLVLLKQNV